MASQITGNVGRLQGLVLPAFRFADVTAFPTQAGPIPGMPVPVSPTSRGRLEMTGGQGTDITLRCGVGGSAGIDGEVGGLVAWPANSAINTTGPGTIHVRKKAETTLDLYRVRHRPWCLAAFIPIEHDSTADWSAHDVVVLPRTQGLCVVYADTSTTTKLQRRIFVADTTTFEWSAAADVFTTATAGITGGTHALCALPDERLLLVQIGSNASSYTAVSADSGDTWTLTAANSADYTMSAGYTRARCVYHKGEVAYFADGASGNYFQGASTSIGENIDKIEEGIGGIGEAWYLSPVSTPAGTLIVAYRDNATGNVEVRRLGSAYEPFSSVAAIIVETDASTDISAWVDHDGVIWITARNDVVAKKDQQRLYRSDDDGVTWAVATNEWGLFQIDDAATHYRNIATVAWRGGVVITHQHKTDVTTGPENSLSSTFFGGWSNVDRASVGRRKNGIAANVTHTGLPFELPENVGWIAAGAGGHTIGGNGALRFNTVAADDYLSFTLPASTNGHIKPLFFDMEVVSGGSVSTDDVSVELRRSDGVNRTRTFIRFSTTQFRILDDVTTKATITIDMTVPLQMMVSHTLSLLTVYYKRRYETLWTRAANYIPGNVAGVTNSVQFGHRAVTTSESRWWIWPSWNTLLGEFLSRSDALNDVDNDPTSVSMSGARGPFPFPLPVDFDDPSGGPGGVRAPCFVSITDGPLAVRETFTADRQFLHSIERAFPDRWTGAAEKWRSTGDSIGDTFELSPVDAAGASTNLGSWAPCLVVLNANFRTAYLESWNGATWDIRVTYDGAIPAASGTLKYTSNGNSVRPKSDTGTASRYLYNRELVHGTVVLDSSASLRVVGQTPGLWIASTAGVQPDVLVSGAPPAADGTILLVAPSGVAFGFQTSRTFSTKWRIRVPAQLTPDGFFEGKLFAGYMLVFGEGWSFGDAHQRDPSAAFFPTRFGTRRAVKLGPPPRLWTLQHADGYGAQGIRVTDAALPVHGPWMGGTGGLPLATRGDVYERLAGALDELDGGAVPCAVVDAPATAGTLTDPRRWLYGFLSGPSETHVSGDEQGRGERWRGGQWSVVEAV